MTDFRHQYKEKSFWFGNPNQGRVLRAEKRVESQKNERAKVFNKNRNILESITSTSQGEDTRKNQTVEDRVTKLVKWKAERDRRKKMAIVKKKPPFKVGIVRHKVYSPLNKDTNVLQTTTQEKVQKQVEPVSNAARRITRATEKRLLAKAQAVKKLPIKKEANIDNKVPKKQANSFAPIDHEFKAPPGLPQMPLFGRVPLPMSSNHIKGFVFSPRKVTRRSKRKSMTPFTIANISPKKEIVKQEEPSEKDQTALEANNTNRNESVNKADLSIEPVTLKLSSEEEESYKSPNEKKRNKKNTTLNTSYTISPQDNDHKLNSSTKLKKLNRSVEVKKSDSPSEPVFFSPYVITSRGKNNARKEQQSRRGIGCSPSNDIPTKETVMQNLNISVEEEERTAKYFHFILNKEIERLNDLCNKWVEIQEELDTTEDAKYQINQTIGQTNLLINKKFERFRGLVRDCETGKGEMLVTCKDLQGFWDMMYMEVKDCDSRFEKLEKLRSNNWQEEQPTSLNVVVKKKGVKKKKVVPNKQSSLRALIVAARKKKLAGNNEGNDDSDKNKDAILPNANEKSQTETKLNNRRSKSLGLADLKSPAAKLKNTRMSLLHKVQLSNTNKRLSSPLAIMKISQMCKTPEVHLDDTISYVNSNQTPGKSILKRSAESISSVKSAHKVNFNDNVVLNEVPIDEETRTKLDLAAALARIDSYDFDAPADACISAERKLNFEDDSFDENLPCNNNHGEENSTNKSTTQEKETKIDVPLIQVQIATPLAESASNALNTSTPKEHLTKRAQNLITKSVAVSLVDVMAVLPSVLSDSTKKSDESKQKSPVEANMNDTLDSVKILRSRTISSVHTPKSKNKNLKVSINVEESEQKENKTPSKSREKDFSKRRSTKVDIQENSMSLENAIGQISLDDNYEKRRRSRRSVKFVNDQMEKECPGCVLGQVVLPMTPHVRKSRSRRSENRKSAITEDLISWETPEKLPERVRRSQSKKQ